MRCLWVFCTAEDGEVCHDVVVNEVYDSAVWHVSYDITFMIDAMIRIPIVLLMGMTGMNGQWIDVRTFARFAFRIRRWICASS
jgi:hypothetical protein